MYSRRSTQRTLGNVAAEPNAEAVELIGARAVDDDALGEALVVLQQQHDALLKVLLPERKTELLFCPPKDDTALLENRALVDKPFVLWALTSFRFLLSDKACAHLAPVNVLCASAVHIFVHALGT